VESEGDFVPDSDQLLNTFAQTGVRKGGLFDPDMGQALKIIRRETVSLKGRETVRYEYRYQSQDQGSVSGTVWVDQENLLPVRVSSQPESTSGRLTENSVDMNFQVDKKGEWVPVSIQMRGIRKGIITREISLSMELDNFVELAE